MERFVCIHGHFYQPPRENPWLEEIEIQDSAHPYHDWNERITAECYAPNSASRILDGEDRILDIVGNYSRIDFDFGPTLLSWMETHSPDVYGAVIDADRESVISRSGHGNAIAQTYNHIIMPLANTRDKRTQIKWGMRDFEYRFKRPPEGMWLSETAVDGETLDIMAECGIRFTVLATHQARSVREIGAEEWEDVSGNGIDPTRPYLIRMPSGRSMSLFFYDGQIAKAVAFENLLDRGEDFVTRMIGGFSDQTQRPQLVSIATDGETYGHHHRFGEMALAYAVHKLEQGELATLTNYSEYLANHPPGHEVLVAENTSWSCAHGVERWRSDCSCNSGGHQGWNQGWRGPLRGALDWLRDELTMRFEGQAGKYLRDPWAAREAYIDVILNRSEESIESFLAGHSINELTGEEKTIVLKLMEMQRHLMLMYTSCGWFFDELSGIETVQVIQYAGRVIQLAEEIFKISIEETFKGKLSEAKSNLKEVGDGALIYEKSVKPAMVGPEKLAAHYAISSLIEDYGDSSTVYGYTVVRDDYQKLQAGVAKLAAGQIRVTSTITRDSEVACFAVLHLGGHVINGGVHVSFDCGEFQAVKGEIVSAFERGAFVDIIRTIDRYFGVHTYSLLHLFRDEQRKVLSHVISENLEMVERAYDLVFENNRILMLFLRETAMPIPKPFLIAAEFTLGHDVKRALKGKEVDVGRVQDALNEIRRWSVALDQVDIEFTLRRTMEEAMDHFADSSGDPASFSRVKALIELLPMLPLEVNLWRIQNTYFKMARTVYVDFLGKAMAADEDAVRWVETFKQIGRDLFFNVDAILPRA
jgi:alpha-amylase/alpha-mannosidase (GH57 family)